MKLLRKKSSQIEFIINKIDLSVTQPRRLDEVDVIRIVMHKIHSIKPFAPTESTTFSILDANCFNANRIEDVEQELSQSHLVFFFHSKMHFSKSSDDWINDSSFITMVVFEKISLRWRRIDQHLDVFFQLSLCLNEIFENWQYPYKKHSNTTSLSQLDVFSESRHLL